MGGKEFIASETKSFFAKWNVRHRLSSAYFPQSNGRAEVAVKKCKRLLMDNIGPNGSLNNDNFLRAILAVRNTPDPDCKISPAEILFGRPLRDAFSFVNRLNKFESSTIRPTWKEAWNHKEEALKTRYTRTMESLNKSARDLPQLEEGDRVFVQNQRGTHPTKWDASGIVMEIGFHDKYVIKVDGSGRLTTRNRRFLRKYTPATLDINHRGPIPLPPIRVIPQVHPQQPPLQHSIPNTSQLLEVEEESTSPQSLPTRSEPVDTPGASPSPSAQLEPTADITLNPHIPALEHPESVPLGGQRTSSRPRNPRKIYIPESGIWE